MKFTTHYKTIYGFLMLMLLMPHLAIAHSRLLDTEPANGAVIDKAPSSLILNFSVPVEHRLCKVEIATNTGWQPLNVQVKSTRLVAGLPALPDGDYEVRWQVLSKDGHVQRGKFTFSIR
jgi:methionine-rich copper-binding protein CopC